MREQERGVRVWSGVKYALLLSIYWHLKQTVNSQMGALVLRDHGILLVSKSIIMLMLFHDIAIPASQP